MTKAQADEVLETLRSVEEAGLEEVDLTEVYCVAEFEAYRNDKKVTIWIEDHGPDCHPAPRFRIHARTDDDCVAVGNGGDTPKAAVSSTYLHWHKLGGPPIE